MQHGDAWLATRVRTAPMAEVFVATRPLDGFTLSIRWGDRWRDSYVGDETFDHLFSLETNDTALMRMWLDENRAAHLASAYSFESDDISLSTLQPIVDSRTWSYELANDELQVTKGAVERNVDRFMVAIDTACAVAARSQRWAAEYGEIARELGGHAASEVELGGAPVITATRSAIEVGMRLLNGFVPSSAHHGSAMAASRSRSTTHDCPTASGSRSRSTTTSSAHPTSARPRRSTMS